MIAALRPGSASAQDIIPPKSYTTTPGGIQLSDGSLVHTVADLEVGPLKLERIHRSGVEQPNYPMFGKNFASNLGIYLAKSQTAGNPYDRLVVHLGMSSSGTYTQYQGTTNIIAWNEDAQKGKLTWDGNRYVYTDSSGTIYKFSATVQENGLPFAGLSRKVESIEFPDGRKQTFSYDANSNLRLVEDSSGAAILFDYNVQNDVSAACEFIRAETYISTSSTCAGAAHKVTYTYTYTSPRYLLTSVTDVMGKTTTYTNTTKGITCIKPPGYSTCKFSITSQQVNDSTHINFKATQVMQDGAVWHMQGFDETSTPSNKEQTVSPYDCAAEVVLTDPDGKQTFLSFTKSSPCGVTDPNGSSTKFKFRGAIPGTNPGSRTGTFLVQAIYPEGDQYLAEYNGPFGSVTKETHVPKPGSGLANLVKEYGYNSCTTSPGTYQNCAKPIWIKDPNGNTSNFSYANHGGVLTEMGSAPAAGGARPLKVTTYLQRYAWVKNSAGSLVQGLTPIWVKTSETVCQTIAGLNPSPVCDNSAQKQVTSYEYGANGTGESLLVKGVAVSAYGQTLRTCYTYDAWHRKISEAQPLGTSGACP